MAISRATGYTQFSAGNHLPVQYSTYLLAKYFAEQVVPQISNNDYKGDISKPGDTVYVRSKPTITVYDLVVGENLSVQNDLAIGSTPLTIDYGKYCNVELEDVDEFLSDLELRMEIMDDAANQIGDTIEQVVLQTIPAVAIGDNTVTVSGDTGETGLDSTNVLRYFDQCALKLNEQKIPQENRWMVIDPITAHFALGSDLRTANVTGGINDTIRSGKIGRKLSGFEMYMSTNLTYDSTSSQCIFGHRDALTFAAKFTETEVVRSELRFADFLRCLTLFGFKVLQTAAFGLLDIELFNTDLNA